MLDALTPPVHRDGRPAYLTPGADFYRGRRAQPRPARQPAAPRRCRLPLRRLPGLPARLLAVLRRERGLAPPCIYEIIVAERLDLARVVVASSQAAMGEGLYRCPVDGEQTPGMRPERALRPGSGTSRARCAAARWRCRPRRSASRTRRTPTACPSSARRWSPSTWAAGTASRPSRSGTASSRAPGSRSTTPTRAPAASSA